MLDLYLRVVGRLGAERRLAAGLVAANLALAVAGFAEPMLMGRIVDGLTRLGRDEDAFARLAPTVLAWVAFGLFTIAAGAAVALHADKLSHRNKLAAMSGYFGHVLELPLAFHSGTHSGRVLKAMLDGTAGMAWLWLGFFRDHLVALVSLCVLLPATLFVNPVLGSILLALVATFGCLTAFVVRRTESLQGQVERHNSSLAEHASDALGNVAVIQSFTRASAERDAMQRIIADLLAAQVPVLSWWAVANVATKAAATLTMTAVFVAGIALHQRGAATVGEIVAFTSLASLLIGRLEQAVAFVNGLFQATPKIREFFDVLDTVPAVADRAGAVRLDRPAGDVAFEDVRFSYDGRRDALAGVTLRARPGEVVALVGATGSGKSTAMGLLHRTFDPGAGRVTIDGVDLRDVALSSLRENVGVVFQEPMLFARTIRENLQVGRPDATDAEMHAALDRAQAGEFMARQPDGLDTVLGERGRSLSGGERQRLSIARALLKDPPVLVLDEATSALDAATERRLQGALDAVMEGRTTFVIAHRLATVRKADRILVLDGGRVVEEGGFDELVAAGGRFAELARAQYLVPGVPVALAA